MTLRISPKQRRGATPGAIPFQSVFRSGQDPGVIPKLKIIIARKIQCARRIGLYGSKEVVLLALLQLKRQAFIKRMIQRLRLRGEKFNFLKIML